MDFQLTEPRLSPQQQTLLVRTGLVLLALAVVMTTVLLVLTRSHHGTVLAHVATRGSSRHPAQLCNATSCHLAAALLKETLNGSGSPCDDFYAFVCSGWLRRSSFASTHDTQAALLSWGARSRLRQIARNPATTTPRTGTRTTASQRQELLVTDDHRPAPSSTKAAALYNDCLEASMMHRTDALAVFLKDVGLGFPNHVQKPFELAIKIDLYYNLKTLFDLRRHPTWRRPDGRPLLSMGRRPDLGPWRRERDHMRRHGAYLEFVQRYVVAIVAHVSGIVRRAIEKTQGNSKI